MMYNRTKIQRTLYFEMGRMIYLRKIKQPIKASFSLKAAGERLSGNVYEAIEQFAMICGACKKASGRSYEMGDHAIVQIVHSEGNTVLRLTCRARALGECLPPGYEWLANKNDINEICYAAEHLEGYVLETYVSNVPTERDTVFYAYKKGDPHAVGEAQMADVRGGENHLMMLIHFQTKKLL